MSEEAYPIDAVANTQVPILRWDFTKPRGKVQKAFYMSELFAAASIFASIFEVGLVDFCRPHICDLFLDWFSRVGINCSRSSVVATGRSRLDISVQTNNSSPARSLCTQE